MLIDAIEKRIDFSLFFFIALVRFHNPPLMWVKRLAMKNKDKHQSFKTLIKVSMNPKKLIVLYIFSYSTPLIILKHILNALSIKD